MAMYTEQTLLDSIREHKKLLVTLENSANPSKAELTARKDHLKRHIKGLTEMRAGRALLPEQGMYGKTWEEITNG